MQQVSTAGAANKSNSGSRRNNKKKNVCLPRQCKDLLKYVAVEAPGVRDLALGSIHIHEPVLNLGSRGAINSWVEDGGCCRFGPHALFRPATDSSASEVPERVVAPGLEFLVDDLRRDGT